MRLTDPAKTGLRLPAGEQQSASLAMIRRDDASSVAGCLTPVKVQGQQLTSIHGEGAGQMKHVFSILALVAVGVQSSNAAFADSDRMNDRYRSSFGDRHHVDTLADRMQREANSICWEMYNNYRHERGFRETYREMYTILEDAIHIHDLAHDDAHRHGNNEDHIAEDLHDIDRLFHHVEDDIRHWTSRNRYHSHDLTYRMERLESTLHHLMDDYGVRSKRPAPRPNGPGSPPVPVLPAP